MGYIALWAQGKATVQFAGYSSKQECIEYLQAVHRDLKDDPDTDADDFMIGYIEPTTGEQSCPQIVVIGGQVYALTPMASVQNTVNVDTRFLQDAS